MTRTTPGDVLTVAGRELGTVETPGNRTAYGAWYGMDGVPWCAEFVSWVLWTAYRANGEPSPLEGVQNSKGAAYCPFIVQWARKAGLWRADPSAGALALYDWDRDGVADHVGIVVTGGVEFETIEGNTSDASTNNGGQVMHRVRRNDRGYVLGFAALPYGPLRPTPPAGPAWPGRSFALTSPLTRGQDVALWQQQMRARGWSLSVDGLYGHDSADTCSAFQREKGLTADGIVGPVTWRATWSAPVTR